MLLSVVIANYNYGQYLEAAIRSVLAQGRKDVELIVVDGGSTDDSVEVIRRYEGHLAWWVSERDRGQSEAFNKGFEKASGKYLTWLNADDLMPAGSLDRICRELKRHPKCDWFTGNFFRFVESGEVIEVGWGPHVYPRLLQRPNSPVVVFGPTSFFSKRIWTEVGKIDEGLHLIMDTDLWIRFMMAGIKQRRINCFCWAFRMHAASKTAEFGNHVLDEKMARRMREENEIVKAKTHYRCSAALHRLLLLWRLLDGSFLRRMYLQRTFRHYLAGGGE